MDHPRIRGEHLQCFLHFPEPGGSSPHTRGALAADLLHRRQTGIIPAYAGSTRDRVFGEDALGDHPRIRGEHPRSCSTVAVSLGSSPHTRGAPVNLVQGLVELRIIPAYAGSTQPRESTGSLGQDHPRIRGEHGFFRQVAGEAFGSSPHTRGAPSHSRRRAVGNGIIPAYAGSTGRRRSGTAG